MKKENDFSHYFFRRAFSEVLRSYKERNVPFIKYHCEFVTTTNVVELSVELILFDALKKGLSRRSDSDNLSVSPLAYGLKWKERREFKISHTVARLSSSSSLFLNISCIHYVLRVT